MMLPFSFQKWIDDNRHLLKPPVGNKLIWEDSEFIVMVVGGPNSRTDFHVDKSEEFFYQVEGNINLKIFKDGAIQDLPISQGQIFLLPADVPHSPQRPANSVGLVIERKRRADETDGFQWYCPTCNTKVYEEFLHISNIVTQLPEVFDRFYSNPTNCTCKKCGFVFKKTP